MIFQKTKFVLLLMLLLLLHQKRFSSFAVSSICWRRFHTFLKFLKSYLMMAAKLDTGTTDDSGSGLALYCGGAHTMCKQYLR